MTLPPNKASPLLFEEFFELGLDESSSPFLTPDSRKWSHHLSLKTALLSAMLLFTAFILSFYPSIDPLSKILLTIVYLLVGIPPLIDSIDDLLSLEINIDILMTIAAFSSFLLGGEIEGALLLVLFSLSHAMEDTAENKAKEAISHLTKLSPTTAFVMENDGVLVEKSVNDIKPGTKILIKAGGIVPLDAKIVKGTSSLNLVHLTGENLPITKIPGDLIPSGAKNMEGALEAEVTKTNNDSTLFKIVSLVTEAQEARPKLQLWFDKVSSKYAMLIISLSALFALSFPFLFNIPFFSQEGSIYRALSFLIAASPCALIIAVPIAYLSAISICAKNGILLKGGMTLDALARCKIFAFDKTGTLTYGKLKLTKIEALDDHAIENKNFILSIAYGLERNAIHPIAEGINNYAIENKIIPIEIHSFKSVPGYGLEGNIYLKDTLTHCFIGNVEFILDKIDPSMLEKFHAYTKDAKEKGEILCTLIIGKDIYFLHFSDVPRPAIKETLDKLRNEENMRLVMLTGDHFESAQKIAKVMGIDEFYADLRPEDKLRYIGKISHEEGLAMIGDGINDAPALARATVGICMGKMGSSIAVDASDIILLQDNIQQIGWLVHKAHQTGRIVKQNLAIAVSAIFLAALPALIGYIPLWLAVILHEGGTVIVAFNALRLLRR